MNKKQLLNRLAGFDPALYDIMADEISRQSDTLSFIPTANAASPFSSYLKGSVLGNEIVDHHTEHNHTRLEEMACSRAAELFGADHAIVRLGSLATASRVVLFALAEKGDTILSFNGRKKEYCSGDRLDFHWVNFSISPDKEALDLDAVDFLAKECRPKVVIYSPVNNPHNIDYVRLEQIAHHVGATLWVDLGQDAGLIAAGVIPSPVPYADVVTFPAYVLHGPQNGVILCRNTYAEKLVETVHATGHSSLKKNVLAALAITFREAKTPEFRAYGEQVLANAKALEKGLQAEGIHCNGAPTQNHLVLARLPEGRNAEDVTRLCADADILVKGENLLTSDPDVTTPILRLSTLDPTTRSLKEEDMEKMGHIIGRLLNGTGDQTSAKEAKAEVKRIIGGLPLFSEEWLPDSEVSRSSDSDNLSYMMNWNM